MPRFERTFQIPPSHRLEQVRTRARGGLVRATYWDHEEYDTQNRLVARYHTFWESQATGEDACGWRKYDSNGHMVDAQDLAASKGRTLFDEA
jgi:hypothetical protein